jgi:hypothetical protein
MSSGILYRRAGGCYNPAGCKDSRHAATPPSHRQTNFRACRKSLPRRLQATPVTQLVHTAVTQLNTLSGCGLHGRVEQPAAQWADAAPLIAQPYHAAPEPAYRDRWSFVKVLADLQRPDSLSHLETSASARGEGPGSRAPIIRGDDDSHHGRRRYSTTTLSS